MVDVGRTLEALARSREKTGAQLARDSHVDPKTITAAYASDSFVIRPERFRRVLAALGVTFDRFVRMAAMDFRGDENSVFRLHIADAIAEMPQEDLMAVYTYIHTLRRSREPIGPLPAPSTIHDPQMQGPRSRPLAKRTEPRHNDPGAPDSAAHRRA